MRLRHYALCILRSTLALCALSVLNAQSAPSLKIHQSGPFRVLYYTEGALAVNSADVNQNGIPDRVEDILTSAIASRLLFCRVLGYPDPLNSKRLPKVRFIDIRMDASAGVTSRKVVFPKDIPGGNPPDAGSLVIHVSPTRGFRPFAVPHEFFHLVQYAATHCSVKWFIEGTASWSEGQEINRSDRPPSKKGSWGATIPLDHWPLEPEEASRIFEMSYSAREFLWNRLALLCDNDGEIPRGPAFEELSAMKYSDGAPVIKDTKLVGWRLMRDVFLQLGKIDGDQNVRKDNAAVLRAVEKAVAKHLPRQMPAKGAPMVADVVEEKAETLVHQVGDIRVLYQLSGIDAVKPDDLNENGVPDQVEDALTQVAAARMLFVDLLGFFDPLRAKRFNGARYVDIRFVSDKDTFLRFKERTSVKFPEGISDGVPEDEGSLTIKCKQGVNLRRSSVLAQDYFHLIGQASTRGNAWWCLGGMAVWSGSGFSSPTPKQVSPLEKWPLSPDMAQKLFHMRADSVDFLWRPLVALRDSDGELPRRPVFEKLRAMKYTDGTPVLKSAQLPGWRLMRAVLAELGKLDNDTRAYRDNAAILRAIEKAVILRAAEKAAARQQAEG